MQPDTPIPQDLPIPVPKTPWNISPQLWQRCAKGAGETYSKCEVLPTDPEAQFVMRYFAHNKPHNYAITKIFCIHNPDLTSSFEAGIKVSEQEAENPVFKGAGQNEAPAADRARALERWLACTRSYSPVKIKGLKRTDKFTDTKVLPLWQGTSAQACHSISRSGFAYFGKHDHFHEAAGSGHNDSTDIGYFGSGIYFTNSAAYASLYSSGQLFLSWVSMREPYPVVRDCKLPGQGSDMAKLQGHGAYQNYNAHYIPVVSIQPNDPSCMVYYPCQGAETPACDEYVVFNKNQTLPRFWIELGLDAPEKLLKGTSPKPFGPAPTKVEPKLKLETSRYHMPGEQLMRGKADLRRVAAHTNLRVTKQFAADKELLRALSQQLSGVLSLDFTGCCRCDEVGLLSVFGALPSTLQILRLDECHLSGLLFSKLVVNLPTHLRVLSTGSAEVSKQELVLLCQKMPKGLSTLQFWPRTNEWCADDTVEQLSKSLPSTLFRLEIDLGQVSDGAMALFLKHLPQGLGQLSLRSFKTGLACLWNRVPPNLHHLSVNHYLATEKSAEAYSKQLPSTLVTLEINCAGMDTRTLDDVLSKLPVGLKRLTVSGQHQFTDTHYALLGQHLPRGLKSLKLQDGNVGPSQLNELALGFLTSLEELELAKCGLPADFGRQLPKATKRLCLRDVSGVSSLASGGWSENLETLTLSGNFSWAVDELGAALPKELKNLELNAGQGALESLAKHLPPNLQRLSLGRFGCRYDLKLDQFCKQLPPTVTYFHLDWLNSYCDADIGAISQSLPKGLQELHLFGSLSGQSAERPVRFPTGLKKLSLTACHDLSTSCWQSIFMALPEKLESLAAFGRECCVPQSLPPNLQILDLSYCDRLTSEQLCSLSTRLPASLHTLKADQCRGLIGGQLDTVTQKLKDRGITVHVASTYY